MEVVIGKTLLLQFAIGAALASIPSTTSILYSHFVMGSRVIVTDKIDNMSIYFTTKVCAVIADEKLNMQYLS